MYECIQIFPNSLKSIVSKSRQKRDMFQLNIEKLLYFFTTKQANKEIQAVLVKILAIVFRSKDKVRIAFSEQVSKCLENIMVYLNMLQPRSFDDKSLNEPMAIKNIYYFVLNEEETGMKDLEAVTAKHVKDHFILSV